MGATRAKIYASFDKKKKKAKGLAAGRTGTNTVDAAGRETYTKPGHAGWKIDTGPAKRTAPKHPGVLSYPSSKRPAGKADPGRRTPTPTELALHTPVGGAGARIKKATVGFGKDVAGKPIGQTTWVDLGKNPSSKMKIKGARMARNQRPTRAQAKAPKAKAPSTKAAYSPKKWKPVNVIAQINKHQRLAPHTPGEPHDKITPASVWKRETNPHIKGQDQASVSWGSNKSISARGIAKAVSIALVGTAALQAATQIGVQQVTDKPRQKKSAAVTAARSRKPVTTPAAPKVKPILPGAAAQASPKLKASSDKRFLLNSLLLVLAA